MRRKRHSLLILLALLISSAPAIVVQPAAVAADVVLPPVLLAGPDAEDDGAGNGNPASRVDTWSYQIQNPNPFPLTATIEVNTATFDKSLVGDPGGTWVPTQVTSVAVPAGGATPVAKRLATPPALGTITDGALYGFRAVWDDYPTVDSNFVGMQWPQLLVIQSSLGAPFTDPGPPFIGGGGTIHGLIDNRGPDFVAGFACLFDAAGTPTGDYTYHWWLENSAFTGNPEIMEVELARPNGSNMPGVSGLSRQTIPWAAVQEGTEAVGGSPVTLNSWQQSRGWFRPAVTNPNPGGTAADNTYPWDGSTPPGSVWSLNSSPFNKHTRPLVQAADCETKYADLPVYNPPGEPVVAITSPAAGTNVSGVVTIQIDATDDDPIGTLDVEVSFDAGANWSTAAWNGGTARYEYAWDTTAAPDGPATIDARATDSEPNTTNAAPISVTIQNAPIPPTASITAPGAGATVNGTVVIEVDATDNDPPGSLIVEVSLDAGANWFTASWNTGTARYEYDWDTTTAPEGQATIDARATDSDPNTTNATPVAVTVDNVVDPALLVTAADIGRCDRTADNDTGALLDTIFAAETGQVALAGDIAYPNGSAADFTCFDDAWGQHFSILNPAPGNHDYFTAGAAGYFGYFGSRAGDPAEGFYSFPISDDWIGIALNSNCAQISGGCAAGGAQEQWLRTTLAANIDKHVVATWHHPRWANNVYNDNPIVADLWQALYDFGAEIVLVGHEHHYERYQPLDGNGNADPTFGVREFIVGTGGTDLRPQQRTPSPLSEEQQYDHHGVLKLYLSTNSYSWEFVSVGGAYSDTGTSPTHSAPSPAPTVAITAPSAGATVSGTVTVEVDATDDDPVGTLDVDVSTDGGANWNSAAWNAGAGRYEYSWDTTAQGNGPATIDARATDTALNTTNAASVGVTIDNPAAGSYRDEVLGDGAVVYWRLGDPSGTVAADEVSANDATYVGSPGLNAPGLIADGNPAVDFDGSDDTVDLPNSIQMNHGGPYTTKSVELWFRAAETSSRQVLLEQGSVTRGLIMYVMNGQLYGGIYNTSDNGGDTPWGPVFVSSPISPNTTYHAVLVFDRPADELRLYVNGAIVATSSGVGELHNHGLSAIGAQRDWARYHDGGRGGDTFFFDGVIDEVALYNSVLASTQVADHYSAGSASGPITPVVSVVAPNPGAIVSGTATVGVTAFDDDPVGSLNVEVSTDGGANWDSAPWNGGANRYEFDWDTTGTADGPATIDARATDSGANTGNASPIAVTVSNAAGAPYRDVVLGDGAWIYWRLGEQAGTSVVDELGNNPNTYLGSPNLGVTGLITDTDTAVDFDGVDDTIRLVNDFRLNQSIFFTKTIELWFEADDTANRQVILEQGSVSRGLNIYIVNGNLYAGVYNTANSGGDTPWGPVFLSTAIVPNTPYHVVITFDQPNDSFRLYVNGTLADSGAGIGGLYPHGRSAIASQWDWARFHDGAQFGNQNYFSGTIDEVAVYPNVLDAATVAQHHAAGTS